MNIRALGVTEEKAVLRSTVRAGGVAAVLFLSVYSMLAHVGALSGGAFPGASTNGAVVLTNLVSALFGVPGSLLLAAIFLIACFNVCVGLISSCAEYFSGLWPRLPYRAWAALFAAVSLLIANAGLDQILRVSVPVLSILYPVAIVLIALSFFQRWLCGLRLVYPAAVLFTGAASILYTLRDLKLLPAGLGDVLGLLPLAAQGLGWLLPTLAGTLLGVALSRLRPTS